MLKLYQFPISHYCEKARWALELKELPYRKVNLLPGPHAKTAKKVAGNSRLPILQHDKRTVQGSAEIITYLDKNFSRRSLTPEDPVEQNLAEAWESYADREIGPQVRLLSYNTLLDHRDIIIPMMTQDCPWYSGVMMKASYPKVSVAMRNLMKINDQSVEQARQRQSQEHREQPRLFFGARRPLHPQQRVAPCGDCSGCSSSVGGGWHVSSCCRSIPCGRWQQLK